MFAIRPNRRYTFKHSMETTGGDPETISVTFDFPYDKELDFSNLEPVFEKLQKLEADEIKADDMKDFTAKEMKLLADTTTDTIKNSLISWEGFGNSLTGKELEILDADGNIIKEHQKAVFYAVESIADLYTKVLTAYTGNRGKN